MHIQGAMLRQHHALTVLDESRFHCQAQMQRTGPMHQLGQRINPCQPLTSYSCAEASYKI